MFDIDDIPVTDDLDVSNDPDTYSDPAPPPLLPEGNYQFRILLGKDGELLKRNRETRELVLVDGKFPVINVAGVEITTEGYEGRKVYVFQQIGTKPYTRRDNAGLEVTVNNLTDLIRSYDASAAFRGTREGLALLNQLINDNAQFAARFTWKADDWRWRADALKALAQEAEAAGVPVPKDKKAEIYNKSSLEGMKKFLNPATGHYSQVWTGPSGNDIEVKVQIASRGIFGFQFIPSLQHNKTRWTTRQAA